MMKIILALVTLLMVSSCAIMKPNKMNEEQKSKLLNLLEYCDFRRLDKSIKRLSRITKDSEPYDVVRINNYTNKQRWANTLMHDKISENELHQWIENATIKISGNDIRIETVCDNLNLKKGKTDFGLVFYPVTTNENGKAMQMICTPIDEMEGARIRLTSHLKDKNGDDVPLSEWVNLRANNIDTLGKKNSRHHILELKIDREKEDELTGYIEVKLLKSINYNRVNVELKSDNLNKKFILDNVSFELAGFEPGNFIIGYDREDHHIVSNWDYFVVTDNQYLNASSSRIRSDFYFQLMQLYENPDMTIGDIIRLYTSDIFKFADIGVTKKMLKKDKELELTKSDIESLFAIDGTPRKEGDISRMAMCFLTNIEKAESVVIFNENSQIDDDTNSIGLLIIHVDNRVERCISNRRD